MQIRASVQRATFLSQCVFLFFFSKTRALSTKGKGRHSDIVFEGWGFEGFKISNGFLMGQRSRNVRGLINWSIGCSSVQTITVISLLHVMKSPSIALNMHKMFFFSSSFLVVLFPCSLDGSTRNGTRPTASGASACVSPCANIVQRRSCRKGPPLISLRKGKRGSATFR